MQYDVAMGARDRFAFVLFKPQLAGNIGAAARAIKNMGFDDLRLVAPGPMNRAVKNREAVAMAVHAGDVLAGAKTYHDLASALEDCSITVGTTARRGGYRSRAQPLRAAAAELATLSQTNKIALVFGREDRGLTNREIKLCDRLVTIPTAPEYPSLNLAQAVVVVAYEIMMAANAPSASETPQFASAVDIDAMLERMAAALVSIGFLPAENPDHIMLSMREIFGRSGLTERERDLLNGLARQMKWVAEGGSVTLADKRRAGRKLR